MNPTWKKWIWWIAFAFVLLVCGLCLFPINDQRSPAILATCLSNIRQQVFALQIYAADSNDYLPPYYSFDGTTASESYMHTLEPYTKVRPGDQYSIYACPAIHFNLNQNPKIKPIETVSERFGYAHCESLKGIIPDFAKGKRSIDLGVTLDDPANIPYLRDVLAADTSKGTHQGILSPHIMSFNIGYLDGHAHRKKPIEINTDL